MSEIKAYAEVVKLMRDHQKDYFQSRSKYALEQSKFYERIVDDTTNYVLGIQPSNQLNIFEQQ